MNENRIELKIIKDKNSQNVELESMSLACVNAFIVLAESISKIIELTPNTEDVRIQFRKGSACIIAQGQSIETIGNEFVDIINQNSANKNLITHWKKIQTLFTTNGFQYEAKLYTSTDIISLYDKLKESKPLKSKNTPKAIIEQAVIFLKGKLISVGGNKPHIVVELNNCETVKINCSQEKANKAKNFLFSSILISAWIKSSSESIEYELCDSYYQEQITIFNDFKEFISNFEKNENKIDALKSLHYKCKLFLEKEEYGILKKFLRLFTYTSFDVNVFKTLLIITQFSKDNPQVKNVREQIQGIFEQKMRSLKLKR